MLPPGMRHAVATMIYIIVIACCPNGAVTGGSLALNNGADGSLQSLSPSSNRGCCQVADAAGQRERRT